MNSWGRKMVRHLILLKTPENVRSYWQKLQANTEKMSALAYTNPPSGQNFARGYLENHLRYLRNFFFYLHEFEMSINYANFSKIHYQWLQIQKKNDDYKWNDPLLKWPICCFLWISEVTIEGKQLDHISRNVREVPFRKAQRVSPYPTFLSFELTSSASGVVTKQIFASKSFAFRRCFC